MIFDLITKSQAGDFNATMELIDKFNPLLRKYAYKLFYDGAYDDLLVDFIELLHKIQLDNIRDRSEGSLVSYLHKSICDSYIKRSKYLKKLNNFVLYSDLSDCELYYVNTACATTDIYFEHELTALCNILTKSELQIINMLYLLGYTVRETAFSLGITRQAVNQMKKRGLKKLKILYADKLN